MIDIDGSRATGSVMDNQEQDQPPVVHMRVSGSS
jgi:hypothetical protein